MGFRTKEWIFLEKSGKKSWRFHSFPICAHYYSVIPNKRVEFREKSGRKSGRKSGKKSGKKSGIPLKKSGINQWNGVARKRVERRMV